MTEKHWTSRVEPGLWVVPNEPGQPCCLVSLFWREPETGGRIGVACGPGMEMSWFGPETQCGRILAAWKARPRP